MTNSNRPKWLDVTKLKQVAGKEAEQQKAFHVNLPTHSRKVVISYTCPQCRLQFTSSDVEKQVKQAVRKGNTYIECPKCAGILREGTKAVVRDNISIVNRADRYQDNNRAISRGINTWIDKAIYGRLVQRTGEYIQQFGIDNPQLKFQRGIRSQKFPGQPKTAKGAEFTVEFIDFNNTRNRIIIQAGLDPQGKLIYPRTFQTLSGTEYPLTKEAITDLTSGKLYDAVMSDASIPPLVYREPDITRFREISAGNDKITKTAQNIDPAAMDATIQGMGVTDPVDIQAMKDVLTKYQGTAAGATPIGAPPAPVDQNMGGGAFMNGVGLSGKLNMKKDADIMNPLPGSENTMGMQESDPIDNSWEQVGVEALYHAVADGLAFPEAYDAVRTATQGHALITQAEFVQMGRTLVGEDNFPSLDMLADRAAALIKQAEMDNVKHLHTTADAVKEEFAFDGMTSSQINQWMDTYINSYNTSLDNGEGLMIASQSAHKTAANELALSNIKLALRDKDTFVPITDPNPDYSIATTDEFETEFGGKYEDTDGGILPMEEREYSTMFKGTTAEINQKTVYADVKKKDNSWVVTPKDSDKVLGTHATEADAVKQLQAIEISKHKKGSVKKRAAYELTPEGYNVLVNITGGQQVAGPNSDALFVVLRWIQDNPTASLDEMAISSGTTVDVDTLRQAVQFAITTGYINISPGEPGEVITGQESMPPGPEIFSNTNKIEKEAEATGVDLDADEVGQNPINYSRLKGLVQDYIRSGNIPPTKVDLQKLKDGGYSLKELRGLVDTFKVNRDALFPTAHSASVDLEALKKRAEEKLGDLFKQMPIEKEVITTPGEGERGADPKVRGGEAPLSGKNIKEEAPEDKLPGGLADGDPSSNFDPEELAMGIEVEKEHTVDKELSEEIAKDHLKEIPDYYTRLEKMEDEAKAELGEGVTDTDSLFASLKATIKQDRKAMGMNPEGMDHVCSYCRGVYDDITGDIIRPLTDEEYATVQSHGICGQCAGRLRQDLVDYRAAQKLQQASTKGVTKTAVNWPWSKDDPEEVPPTVDETVEPAMRIDSPKMLKQKSPGVDDSAPPEASPEQAELMQSLATSKTRVDQLKLEVNRLQIELQQTLAPIQAQIGEEGNNQLRATKALVDLMRALDQELIQTGNQIGYYTEAVVSKKLTPSTQVTLLLDKFGVKAEQVLAEAQANFDKIAELTVGQYKQWPRKSAATEIDTYLATLYQNTYNTIADLLGDVQELNVALVV